MGIMSYMEGIGKIVCPNSKNVNKDKIVASSLSLLNSNSKSIMPCDYLFIWNVFWSLCETSNKLTDKITEVMF